MYQQAALVALFVTDLGGTLTEFQYFLYRRCIWWEEQRDPGPWAHHHWSTPIPTCFFPPLWLAVQEPENLLPCKRPKCLIDDGSKYRSMYSLSISLI